MKKIPYLVVYTSSICIIVNIKTYDDVICYTCDFIEWWINYLRFKKENYNTTRVCNFILKICVAKKWAGDIIGLLEWASKQRNFIYKFKNQVSLEKKKLRITKKRNQQTRMKWKRGRAFILLHRYLCTAS